MIFPITIGCLILGIFLVRRKDGPRSSLALGLAAWLMGVGLAAAPIFRYEVKYSVWVDLFVAGCLAATTAGYLFVRRRPRATPDRHPTEGRELQAAYALAWIGLLGALLLLVDSGVSLSLSSLTDNLATVRESQFDTLEGDVAPGVVAVVGTYAAPCGLVAIVAAVKFGRRGGASLIVLGVTNFVVLTGVSVFVYAGRATLFYVALLAVISAYLGGRRFRLFRPRNVVIVGLSLATIYYFAVSFVGAREASNANSVAVLKGNQRASLQPWLAGPAAGNRGIATSAISLGYFASPLPTLTFYMGRAGGTPGPFYGAYSYPLLARNVARVAGNEYSYADLRKRVFDPLESAGYFGNVWSTWLRDLVVDFGRGGTLLFSALFGAFLAWSRNRYESRGSLHYHLFEVIGCFTFAWGAFTSILPFVLLSTAFFVSIAVMFYVRVSVAPPRAQVLHGPLGQARADTTER